MGVMLICHLFVFKVIICCSCVQFGSHCLSLPCSFLFSGLLSGNANVKSRFILNSSWRECFVTESRSLGKVCCVNKWLFLSNCRQIQGLPKVRQFLIIFPSLPSLYLTRINCKVLNWLLVVDLKSKRCYR